jgi:hypothetical protein
MTMTIRTGIHLSLALILVAIASGCKHDAPTAPAPSGSAGDASALYPISFHYIQDSDGGKAGAGVDVVMVFEPNGIADLYVARDAEAIARKGRYSFNDGRLALTFTDADFKPDVSFTLDTSRGTVTMPFKAFSQGTGSSTWRLERDSPEFTMQVIFNSATLAENLTTPKAIERVTGYANALKSIAASKPVLGKSSIAPRWKITDVQPLDNGVRIQYANGPYLNVALFSWTTGDGTELTTGPLFNDPRTHLDPAPPHDASADPLEKTALFIAPFDGDRETVTWYDYRFLNNLAGSPSELVQQGMGSAFDVDGMSRTLESRGYDVKVLRDGGADVIGIIEALLPGKNGHAHTPGFVAMTTHGNSNGTVFTGTLLGTRDTWQASFKEFTDQLKARGYGDLLTYGGGTEEKPATIEAMALSRTMRPAESGAMIYGVVITPKFWEWLRSRGADFSRSLVFMAACLTDINPQLRDAVRARAYFAFDIPVFINFASRALQYFCASLARPSHTAEETYYNLIRVMNTRQMIFKEDLLLNKMVPESKKQGSDALLFFHGYSFNGAEVISYMSGGWFGSELDQGAVWYLLFSGRWGQDAKAGSQGMLSCWQSVWKDGRTGGIGDICLNKAPGRAPTRNEVAYASYLLGGEPVVGAGDITLIPRWTLNDGR